MGFNESYAMTAAHKYPKNLNKAMDYIQKQITKSESTLDEKESKLNKTVANALNSKEGYLKKKSKPTEIIELKRFQSIQTSNAKHTSQFEIVLKDSARKREFIAPSNQAMNDWISNIRNVLGSESKQRILTLASDRNTRFVSPKNENEINKFEVDIQNEADTDDRKRQVIEYNSECNKDVTKCAAVHRMVTELSLFDVNRESEEEMSAFEYSQLLSDYHHTIECHLSESLALFIAK